jgi:cytidylate kinase
MKPIELLVDQQIKRWELEKKRPESAETAPISPGPVITISRQRGSGGSLVAERLAELTGFSHFNREIIDQISREIGAQKRLVESLDEAARSNFQLWVDGMFRGRIVDSSDYMQSLVKIIGAIFKHGRAIVVGRGANFLADTPNVFNVRIIADMDFRVSSLVKRRGLTRKQAEEEIESNDGQRKKFVKTYFGRDIDDPAAYDLVVNSTYLNVTAVSSLILTSYPLKLITM